ncbi:FAD dependent oxidoreductase [Periconia macrospinosa]|uniref:FAD dependent oxidoreductase n=1 Tax=Periconia macrospinosa TaxID=97972 RepID=A0A2V1DD29_9PLEO|nr:FAD dependent oxidoreductase [Periconia macrospinosa]
MEYDRNQQKTVLVIGGGVSGLMTAWILLDKGYNVSIVAKDWAGKTKQITSQIAGALWEYPPGGCGISEIEVPVLAYSQLEQYQKWAMQSFLFYKKMVDMDQANPKFGARMITLYQFFHHDHSEAPIGGASSKTLETAKKHYEKYEKIHKLDKGEAFHSVNHDGFHVEWGYRHQAPVIDTDKAMEFLMKLVQAKGAVLETRDIKGDLHLHERELLDDFQADIIVNASGLGAHTLANDNQVFPVRGAVKRINIPHEFLKDNAVLLPQQYDASNRPSKTVFIVPRNENTLVVGSIVQRNNWDLNLTHQSPEVEAMWARATDFITHLDAISADMRSNSCRIVHNYGHGGSGWTLAVGCAWTCVKLVEKVLHEGKSGSMANAEIRGLNQC